MSQSDTMLYQSTREVKVYKEEKLFLSEDVSIILGDLHACNSPCFQIIFVNYFLERSSLVFCMKLVAGSLTTLQMSSTG